MSNHESLGGAAAQSSDLLLRLQSCILWGVPSLKSTLPVVTILALGMPLLAQNAAKTPAKPVPAASAKVTQVAANSPKQAPPKAVGSKAAARSAKAKPGKKQPEPQPQAQVPTTPPPAPTPAQLPPTPARVSMRDGLLTIEANNSTLADVLAGVRRETKAAIDLPAGASGERVVANLGPGTPQNVLAALFNGSRFDYIILGSQDQPEAVQRVILRAKSGPEPAPNAVATNGNVANSVNRAPQPAEVEQNDDNDQGAPAEEAPDESNNQQQQQQPPQQEIDGEQQQGQQQNPQQQQPGVKTPEQLLEELRQMQQQQQQNQNQQQPQQQQPQPQQPAPDEQ
jgi:hypothetical protein